MRTPLVNVYLEPKNQATLTFDLEVKVHIANVNPMGIKKWLIRKAYKTYGHDFYTVKGRHEDLSPDRQSMALT